MIGQLHCDNSAVGTTEVKEVLNNKNLKKTIIYRVVLTNPGFGPFFAIFDFLALPQVPI